MKIGGWFSKLALFSSGLLNFCYGFERSCTHWSDADFLGQMYVEKTTKGATACNFLKVGAAHDDHDGSEPHYKSHKN